MKSFETKLLSLWGFWDNLKTLVSYLIAPNCYHVCCTYNELSDHGHNTLPKRYQNSALEDDKAVSVFVKLNQHISKYFNRL